MLSVWLLGESDYFIDRQSFFEDAADLIQFCLGSQRLRREPSTFRHWTEDVDYTHTVLVELEEQEVADETVLLMQY